MLITSVDNKKIKDVVRLKQKKYRDLENKFIVEGIKMVQEAIMENSKISKIVICEDFMNDSSLKQKLMYEIAKQD